MVLPFARRQHRQAQLNYIAVFGQQRRFCNPCRVKNDNSLRLAHFLYDFGLLSRKSCLSSYFFYEQSLLMQRLVGGSTRIAARPSSVLPSTNFKIIADPASWLRF
jgi:hypothetical protein